MNQEAEIENKAAEKTKKNEEQRAADNKSYRDWETVQIAKCIR